MSGGNSGSTLTSAGRLHGHTRRSSGKTPESLIASRKLYAKYAGRLTLRGEASMWRSGAPEASGERGTILACMAVLAGVPKAEAVEWVRENYNPYAVELDLQGRPVQEALGRAVCGLRARRHPCGALTPAGGPPSPSPRSGLDRGGPNH